MNFEALSQIVFAEPFRVAPEHTASRAVRPGLADVLSTSRLLAAVEAMCIARMQPFVDDPRHTIVGTGMRIHHRAPAMPGEVVTVGGWVVEVRDGAEGCGANFRIVVVCDGCELADLDLCFAIVERERVQRRRAARVDQRAPVPALGYAFA